MAPKDSALRLSSPELKEFMQREYQLETEVFYETGFDISESQGTVTKAYVAKLTPLYEEFDIKLPASWAEAVED